MEGLGILGIFEIHLVEVLQGTSTKNSGRTNGEVRWKLYAYGKVVGLARSLAGIEILVAIWPRGGVKT